ncbi:MAG: hypothetical protein RL693_283 [Verrucomicrobiota bacterium]|jgi:ribosome-associated translation inhibitor RaiA
MKLKPVQITFRHMDPSPAVEARIQEEVAELDQYFDGITSCRVVVESPHRHHERGWGFHVSIEIHVPGSTIMVNHEPSQNSVLAQSEDGKREKHLEVHPDHKDVYVCIRDAFKVAHRRVDEYARVLRSENRRHAIEEVLEA